MNLHRHLTGKTLEYRIEGELVAWFEIDGRLFMNKSSIDAEWIPSFYKWLDQIMGEYL